MRILRRFLVLIALTVLVLTACNIGKDLSVANGEEYPAPLYAIELPSGAVLQSATLRLFVNHIFGEYTAPLRVNVHRVNVPWDESTVTWNSFFPTGPFGSSCEATPATSFDVTAGWQLYEVDITKIVAEWIAGTAPNHGILLWQEVQQAGVSFLSSEMSYVDFSVEWRPTLVLRFNSPDSGTLTIRDTDTSNDIPDAIIWAGDWWGNQMLGADNYFRKFLRVGPYYVDGYGWKTTASLVGLNLIAAPEGSGTRTIGYWKNHAGFGPQPDVLSQWLPIWLGTPEGAKSIQVTDAAQAIELLKAKSTEGNARNGILKLYAQLLAAKLNIASGASGAVILGTISAADVFLSSANASSWTSLGKSMQQKVLGWMTLLDAYNNGIIGPVHAEE